MDSQDFNSGVDFTALSSIEGSDIQNAVELASPKQDLADVNDGKGLVVVTTDINLDTPEVPDATTTTKWKRYAWLRRPFGISQNAGEKPRLYLWQDNAPNHATFLKWVELTVDLDDLEADVANALATANNAQVSIELFSATIATMQTNVTAAVNTANSALNTAQTVESDLAATDTIADQALANAQSALALRVPNVVLVPGTALQRLRTNAAGNGVEWFSAKNLRAIVQETTANGVDASAFASGAPNTRVFDTVLYDPANLVDIVDVGGHKSIQFNVSGLYKIHIRFPWFFTGSGAAGTLYSRPYFFEDAGVKFMVGNAFGLDVITAGQDDVHLPEQIITGYQQVVAGETYVAYQYANFTNVTVSGGRASSVLTDREIYCTVDIELVDA